jgi:hypothetical protein
MFGKLLLWIIFGFNYFVNNKLFVNKFVNNKLFVNKFVNNK